MVWLPVDVHFFSLLTNPRMSTYRMYLFSCRLNNYIIASSSSVDYIPAPWSLRYQEATWRQDDSLIVLLATLCDCLCRLLSQVVQSKFLNWYICCVILCYWLVLVNYFTLYMYSKHWVLSTGSEQVLSKPWKARITRLTRQSIPLFPIHISNLLGCWSLHFVSLNFLMSLFRENDLQVLVNLIRKVIRGPWSQPRIRPKAGSRCIRSNSKVFPQLFDHAYGHGSYFPHSQSEINHSSLLDPWSTWEIWTGGTWVSSKYKYSKRERYTLYFCMQRKLGQGSDGVVYVAREAFGCRKIALKVFYSDRSTSVQNEKNAVSHLCILGETQFNSHFFNSLFAEWATTKWR